MNTEQRIAQLERDVKMLIQQNNALKNIATLPYDVDKTFEGRNFLKYASVEVIDPEAYDTLNTLLPTDTTDFPVLAFPIRWLKINLTLGTNGQSFLIPIYTLSDV
jgi:hypothetical protein